MPRTSTVGRDQSELLLVLHHVARRVLGGRILVVVALAGACTTAPVMRITEVSGLIGRHLVMVRVRLVSVVQVELAGRGRRRRRRSSLHVMSRQTVNRVVRMRRRRAVSGHSASRTHRAHNTRMVRMMWMMRRREHGETVVERNHFRNVKQTKQMKIVFS